MGQIRDKELRGSERLTSNTVVSKKENTTDEIADVRGLDGPLFLLGSVLRIQNSPADPSGPICVCSKAPDPGPLVVLNLLYLVLSPVHTLEVWSVMWAQCETSFDNLL